MKIILTGATGYVGSEILKQCLSHHFISQIFVVTRRPISQDISSHKKVIEYILDDFENWPDTLITTLSNQGAEACIWALGGKVSQFKDLDEARRIGISFPTIAAEIFAKNFASTAVPWAGYPQKAKPYGVQHFPFRMVLISAWGAEQDQFRTLWTMSEDRKIKGAAEKGVFEIADSSEEIDGHRSFEAIALRPGGVLAPGDSIYNLVSETVVPCVTVDRLAKVAINTVLDGLTDGKRILENKDLLGSEWAMINSLRRE